MRRFAFPLERVRQWRATQVELELAALERLFSAMRRLDEEEFDLRTGLRNARLELAEEAGAGRQVSAPALLRLDDYGHFVQRGIERIGSRRQDLSRRIEEQRGRLVTARRNQRLLDKLRERALSEWQRQHDRELENQAGELYLARWRRREATGC